jgi:predicted component of type VI protein secretion system
VTVGRATRANFAVPHDTFMSSLHFSVEFGSRGCLLTDQKSSNGTFVNETRVNQAILKNGDEVRSGKTIFVVRLVDEEPALGGPKAATPAGIPSPSPKPIRETERTASLSEDQKRGYSSGPAAGKAQTPLAPRRASGMPALMIGNWTLSMIPDGWNPQGDYGIQQNMTEGFPSSVVVTEEPLAEGMSLQQYVEAQLAMLRKYLREPQIDATLPPKIQGAEETIAVDVRYKTSNGQGIFYRRIYSRFGRGVGILTSTSLESDHPRLRATFDAIISGASFGRAVTS